MTKYKPNKQLLKRHVIVKGFKSYESFYFIFQNISQCLHVAELPQIEEHLRSKYEVISSKTPIIWWALDSEIAIPFVTKNNNLRAFAKVQGMCIAKNFKGQTKLGLLTQVRW